MASVARTMELWKEAKIVIHENALPPTSLSGSKTWLFLYKHRSKMNAVRQRNLRCIFKN